MSNKKLSRPAAIIAASTLLAITLVAIPAATPTPVPQAFADNPCSVNGVADVPNLRGQNGASPYFYGTDSEVGVYVAGDWLVDSNSSEAEGTLVVEGTATFDSGAYFNLGTVGAGSQVVPPANADMLITGTGVTVGSGFLEVGNNRGGNIVSGGPVLPLPWTGSYALNGGTITENVAGALTPYASVPTHYQALSTQFSGLTDTGTVTNDAGNVYFTSTNTDTRQVFTVAGSDLGSIGATKSMVFANIPVGAIIVINVTGSSVVLSANSFTINGTTINPTAVDPDRVFSTWTQSIMWNFETATNVVLGESDQLLGSVMVPTAASTLTLYTSTNGRLFVNGDLVMGGSTQAGLEIHNYPFREEQPCSTTGDFAITKSITDPDGAATAGRTYSGTYECTLASATVASGTWSVTTSGTFTVDDVPTGATCEVLTEDLSSPPAVAYAWDAPSFSPSSVVVGDGTTVTIDVQNTVTNSVGSLEISKTLTDADGVVTAGRTFTGAYSCTLSSVVVASGTWSATTTTPDTITGLPDGATCTLTEDLSAAPSATDSSYMWQTVVVSPTTQTIVAASTVNQEVQNTVRRALGDVEMIKILDDPFNVVDLSRIYTGTFECSHLSATIESGTWSTTAGAGPVSLATDLPFGTECTLAEDALTDPPLAGFPQYIWRAPSISPAVLTIGDGTTGRFTVTNTVYDPFDVLAATGTDVAMPLLVGSGAMVAGILALAFGYRRRRSV